MATALADMLPALRLCIGDEMLSGTYDHTDDALLGNLRAVVRMGLGLPCVSVDPGNDAQLLHATNGDSALSADEFRALCEKLPRRAGEHPLHTKNPSNRAALPSPFAHPFSHSRRGGQSV